MAEPLYDPLEDEFDPSVGIMSQQVATMNYPDDEWYASVGYHGAGSGGAGGADQGSPVSWFDRPMSDRASRAANVPSRLFGGLGAEVRKAAGGPGEHVSELNKGELSKATAETTRKTRELSKREPGPDAGSSEPVASRIAAGLADVALADDEKKRAPAAIRPSSGRARGPDLPPELSEYGGFYYRPDYLSKLEEAERDGRVSPKQAAEMRTKWEVSPLGHEAQIARDQATSDVDFAEKQLSALQKAHVDMEAQRAAQIRQQESYFEEHERQLASLERANQDLARTRVDPNRAWNDKSAWQKVLTAISAGLGAAGASMTGRENTAMKIIQSEIDRDVAAQTEDLDTRKSAIGARQSLVGVMRQNFQDKEEAEAAATAYRYRSLADQFAIYKAETYPENIRRNAELFETKLIQEANNALGVFERRRAAAAGAAADQAAKQARADEMNKIFKSMGLPPLASMSKGEVALYDRAHGLMLGERKVDADAATSLSKARGDEGSRFLSIQGQNLLFPDKELRDRAAAAAEGMDRVRAITPVYKELAEKAGITGAWYAEDEAKMKAAQLELAMAHTMISYGIREPNAEQLRLYREAIPDLADVDWKGLVLGSRKDRVKAATATADAYLAEATDKVMGHINRGQAAPVGVASAAANIPPPVQMRPLPE